MVTGKFCIFSGILTSFAVPLYLVIVIDLPSALVLVLKSGSVVPAVAGATVAGADVAVAPFVHALPPLGLV